MSNDTLKLTDRKVLDYSQEGLQEHMKLEANGYQCTTEDLLNVLLGAAVSRSTLEAVCQDLIDCPHPETIRQYLNAQIKVEDLPELEEQINAAIAGQLPDHLKKKPKDVAIDYHDRAYYGKTTQEEGLWVRGRRKDGTTRYYRVATAYVMHKGMRYTLGIHFVLPEDNTLKVLKSLLRRIKGLGISLKCLFLDKGFSGIDEMRFLSRLRIPALIACTIRGKKGKGGTRALCHGNKSYSTDYTFWGRKGKSFTARLAVCYTFTTAKRTGRMKRRSQWLIYILIHLDWTPRQARKQYRRRFGIETSYRCANQVRGWTTSSNPAYRFLLMALGFYLLNVWVYLQWLYTQIPRPGHRYLATKQFQLSRFAKFISRVLERQYRCVQAIEAVAKPLL